MLSPTDIHLLVGLLTRISRPKGVDLELGSMVFDRAAEEERDVDVTISVHSEEGTISVFEGIEVKDHKRPLDSTQVEGLCTKMLHMPALTRRAIVSASGYWKPAIRKAKFMGVDLLSLVEWSSPRSLGGASFADQFEMTEEAHHWESPPRVVLNPRQRFSEIGGDRDLSTAPIVDSQGRVFQLAPNVQRLCEIIATRLPGLAARQASPKECVGDSKAIRYRCIPGEERPLR